MTTIFWESLRSSGLYNSFQSIWELLKLNFSTCKLYRTSFFHDRFNKTSLECALIRLTSCLMKHSSTLKWSCSSRYTCSTTEYSMTISYAYIIHNKMKWLKASKRWKRRIQTSQMHWNFIIIVKYSVCRSILSTEGTKVQKGPCGWTRILTLLYSSHLYIAWALFLLRMRNWPCSEMATILELSKWHREGRSWSSCVRHEEGWPSKWKET